MSSITAAMLAEMKGQNRVHPTFRLKLAGTTLQFAEEAVCSETAGMYKPYIVSWSGFSLRSGHGNFSLERPRMTVTVFDQERAIQKILGGPGRKSLRGATWSTTWRSFYVVVSEHWTDFNGSVEDVSFDGDRTYTFALAYQLSTLDREVQIPSLTAASWSNAPAARLGTPLYAVYGHMLSTLSAAVVGRVECIPLDTVAAGGTSLAWFCGMGDAVPVQVWHTPSGGSLTIRDDFLPTRQIGGDGMQHGLFTFSGTSPAPGDLVRADVHGIRDGTGTGKVSPTGGIPGTGEPLQNPVGCLRHFLANYGMARQVGGRWQSEAGLLDSVGLDAAEAFFDTRGIRSSFVVSAGENVLSVLNRGLGNFNLVPYVTDVGLLSFRVEDPSDTSIYLDNAHISQRLGQFLGEGGKLPGDTNRTESFNELDYTWGPDGKTAVRMVDPLGETVRAQSRQYDMHDDSLVERYP
jgi:hypothetical protein